MTNRVPTILLLTLALALPAAAQVTLARPGQPALPVVFNAATATPGEQTACAELTSYLHQLTGATFAVAGEGAATGPALYLGDTAFARQHGVDVAALGTEESVLKTVDGNLIVAGGRPRGTLYAVYELLEKYGGVRWYTPAVQVVPPCPTLTLPALDRRWKPYFEYRNNNFLDGNFGYVPDQLHLQAGSYWAVTKEAVDRAPVPGVKLLGQKDSCFWMARNRLNVGIHYMTPAGVQVETPPELGGEFYVAWPTSHSFAYYIPDDKYFADHPEYFALYHGKRHKQGDPAGLGQLCLSNPDLPAVFAQNILEHLKKYPDTYYVSITPNDGAGIMCECDNCRQLAASYGAPAHVSAEGGATCEAGLVLQFVNKVAAIVGPQYPHLMFLTLSYNWTSDPPKNITARDNVIVQICGGVFSSTGRINPRVTMTTPDRARVEAWSHVAKHLWAWDYHCGSPFCCDNCKPLTWSMDRTFKDALSFGSFTGMFMEVEHNGPPVIPDFQEMDTWIATHLLQDPASDADALRRDFCAGYYGPAATPLLRLQDLTRSRLDRYPLRMVDYDYVSQAQRLMAEAERLVAGDPALAARVRDQRINLDMTTLQFRSQIWVDYLARGGKPGDYPYEIPVVKARLLRNLDQVTDLRWYVGQLQSWKISQIVDFYKTHALSLRDQAKEYVEVLCSGAEQAPPLPPELRRLPRDRIVDLTWPLLLSNTLGSVALDPQAALGMTTVEWLDQPFYLERGRMPFELGVWDAYQWKVISPAGLPPRTGLLAQAFPGRLFYDNEVPGPGYHWYTLPAFTMGPYIHTFATQTWGKQTDLSGLYDAAHPDQQWKVYWSIRLRGPNVPFGSVLDPDMFCLDRLLAVKAAPGETLPEKLTPVQPAR